MTAYERRNSDWSSDVCSSYIVAVVPVAAGVRGFGNGRRQRRDDGAGLLEIAELQRDRGADHGLLPLEGQGEVARPIPPIGIGLAEELTGDLVDRLGEAFVGPEDQRKRVLEDEGHLFQIGRAHV